MLRDTGERDKDREKIREKEFMRCFASLVKKEKKREEEEKGMKMKKGIVTEKKLIWGRKEKGREAMIKMCEESCLMLCQTRERREVR